MKIKSNNNINNNINDDYKKRAASAPFKLRTLSLSRMRNVEHMRTRIDNLKKDKSL